MAKGTVTRQSMLWWPTRATSAQAQLIEMIRSEVPTAWGIGNASSKVSAGTITKPPPTPKRPVKKPTTVPATTNFTTVGASRRRSRPRRTAVPPGPTGGRGSPSPTGAAPATAASAPTFVHDGQPVTMRQAATRMSPENASSRTSGSRPRFRADPANEPPMPAMPKSRPARTSTLPARRCSDMPTRDARPTTMSDVVVAAWADSPAT